MLEAFRSDTAEKGLYHFGDRVLLAVSGGIDSVVMTHLAFDADWDFGIAHCNFRLRGAESDADEAFVRQLAARLEVPFLVKHFDVEAEMASQGISLQMAARDLRYAWFSELLDEHAYEALATAHNLNDSVETFFLNLIRGTGIRGLSGIPVRNGRFIRPLLFASRKEIGEYASRKAIGYREDASNAETKYQRNKIRHDVLPQLELINAAFIPIMASNLRRLDETRLLMEQMTGRIREELFIRSGEQIRVEVDKLRALEPFQTWIFELFSPFGFSRSQCEGIGKILEASPGKRSISPSHQIYKDREHLILIRNKNEGFERYYLDSPEKLSSLPFPMDVELMERSALGPIPKEASVACLDLDEIQFPLIIRRWLPGDYFAPLGMEQMKKLSDFFVDEKVPVPEKENSWILASGKKIVWIMGRRIDNRFRITAHTQRVLLLRLQTDV